MEFNTDQTQSLRDEIIQKLTHSVDTVLPDFLNNMPADYFIGVSHDTQLVHLKSLIANHASGRVQDQMFINERDNTITFIQESSDSGQISSALKQLPNEALHAAKIYSSNHGSRVILEFHFGKLKLVDSNDPFQSEKISIIHLYTKRNHLSINIDDLEKHIQVCSERYLKAVTPTAFISNFLLIEKLKNTLDTSVIHKKAKEVDEVHLSIGFGNYDRRRIFTRICRYLDFEDVVISKAILESIEEPNQERVSLIALILKLPNPKSSKCASTLKKWELDLCRIPYLDNRVLEFYHKNRSWDLFHVEILYALSHLAYQKLTKQDPIQFSKNRIMDTLNQQPELAQSCVDLFLHKMDPNEEIWEDKKWQTRAKRFKTHVNKKSNTPSQQIIYHTLIDCVSACLKTNAFMPGRYSLGLKLDPNFLQTVERSELPYGLLFVYGRNFTGFHVRFRDISRGGMRIVQPKNWEEFTLESERHYDEVYDLAYAQQLKNKDIPEGGSKAVILACPTAKPDIAGKVFADTILDLTTQDPEKLKFIKDYYKKPEFIYLGPDERVTPEIINWIVRRAEQKNYPVPNAFMSSKPGAGINHKEYGVTSEGVTVFLEAALRFKNINPYEQTFSVKITGGPDGDVAGNEIRILNRKFGDNVKICGIADGTGCAEDPDGLNKEELLRLVTESKPISFFDVSKLGVKGILKKVEEEDGAAYRNNMHNRVPSDVFVPAGGRPQTINDDNWHLFLKESVPSSAIIIEGANLFITPSARLKLSHAGVLIIKDSSANKCGVICSSMEILASMVLTVNEFLEIKENFVCQVLDQLRALAKLEANALFKEYRHRPNTTLPELSILLSQSINKAKDALCEAFIIMQKNHPDWIDLCIQRYIPQSLLKKVESLEKLKSKTPLIYIQQIIASYLASTIVYKEGINYFEHMDSNAILNLALNYFEKELEVSKMTEEIKNSSIPSKELIIKLLENGGAGTALKSVLPD